MKIFLAGFLVLSFGIARAEGPAAAKDKEAHAAFKAEIQGERDAVASACSEESKVAGCGDKVVGKGLLKCLHEHKKASKEFKVSEGCKSAMKALRSERNRLKGKEKK